MKLVSVKNDLSEHVLLWRPFHITLVEIHHWQLVPKNIEEKITHFDLIPELRYDEIRKA